jgi:hypothetical protein
MSCACKDSSSTFVLLTSKSESQPQRPFIGAVIAVVGALREALEMRRAAQRIHFLGDE